MNKGAHKKKYAKIARKAKKKKLQGRTSLAAY